MPCRQQKFETAAAFTGLVGSGAIAIAGAATIVLSVAGAAGAAASLLGVISALMRLKRCYDEHGETEKADGVRQKLDRLQTQFDDFCRKYGIEPPPAEG